MATFHFLRVQIVRRATQLGLQRADAEDVAQTVLLRVLTGQSPGDGCATKEWAWRVALNGVIDFLRLAKRRRTREATWSDLPLATARDAEWNIAVRQAAARLQALPEPLRSTLLLCLAEGLSHQAAAGVLGVPLGTVKTRVRLGLALVRRSTAEVERSLKTGPSVAVKSKCGGRVVFCSEAGRPASRA